MGCSYWDQLRHSEIISMHGIELDSLHDDDVDFDCSEEEDEDQSDNCQRCSGVGCNYCLMLEW